MSGDGNENKLFKNKPQISAAYFLHHNGAAVPRVMTQLSISVKSWMKN